MGALEWLHVRHLRFFSAEIAEDVHDCLYLGGSFVGLTGLYLGGSFVGLTVLMAEPQPPPLPHRMVEANYRDVIG